MNEKTIELAFLEGQKAGEAARQNDWSRVGFIESYFRKSKLLYSKEESIALQKSFDAGYKDGYGQLYGGTR